MKLKNKGFTLIEVLIALFIVSLVSMSFFMIVNITNRSNAKNEKDIQAMDIAQNEIEHITKDIKDNKNTIDLDLNGDGNIVSTNSLKTNEKINKNKLKEVKEYTSPEYMVRYEGRENTNFQIQVKITTKEINQQVKHFYIYYLNIAVKPISDFTKRTVNISTKVLDNGGI
ncbi:hypothetical protein UT300013_30470 [Paraclostridium sordellii]